MRGPFCRFSPSVHWQILIFSDWPGRNCQRGTFIRRDFGMCSLSFPSPRLINKGQFLAGRIGDLAIGKLERRRCDLDRNNAIGALCEAEPDENNAILGKGRVGAGKSLELVNFRRVRVFDLWYWQPAFRQCRLF